MPPPQHKRPSERSAVQRTQVEIRCRLQELIDQRNLTRTKLSQETGLVASAIRGLCNNTVQRYDRHTLAVLCQYFGIGIGELLDVVSKPDTEQGSSN